MSSGLMKLRQLLVCQYPFAYCDGCLAHHLDVSLPDARAAAVTEARNPALPVTATSATDADESLN
jgi:hypothetical protein